MTTQRLAVSLVVTTSTISVPFTVLHLIANPDDAPITPLQHAAAALANYFGPWGVALVRAVNFPNAGMRSFSWTWALALTAIGFTLILLARYVRRPGLQYLLLASWTLFSLVWFALGALQIASGLM